MSNIWIVPNEIYLILENPYNKLGIMTDDFSTAVLISSQGRFRTGSQRDV